MILPPELEEQFMTDIVAYEEREKKTLRDERGADS
jgi:hypothetical protein